MSAPACNPFSGLKAALTGLLSGGWMGLMLHLFFRRHMTAALTALETLFAQWQAGTLPQAPAAAPVAPRPVAARKPGAASAAGYPRSPGRRPARPARAIAAKAPAAELPAIAPRDRDLPACPRRPPPRRARCRKTLRPATSSHAYIVTKTKQTRQILSKRPKVFLLLFFQKKKTLPFPLPFPLFHANGGRENRTPPPGYRTA